MQPQTDGEYQKLLTEVIKKQIIILGPDITLAKARNVEGLTVADDGTVTQVSGNPQEITKKLIEQFMELSGLIVKKTMEPLLANYPALAVEETAQQYAPPQITSQQPMPSTPPAGGPTPIQPGPTPPTPTSSEPEINKEETQPGNT